MIYVNGQEVVTIERLHGNWFLCEYVDGTFSVTHWQELAVIA